MVGAVLPGGAAAKAGIKPGDVIIEFNGRPVTNTDELVKMVIATKPGTTVPVKVMRDKQERTLHVTVDELDLDAEQQTQRSHAQRQPARYRKTQQGGGFGLTLENVTPQIVAAAAAAVRTVGRARHRGRSGRPVGRRCCAQGDVILSVNRKPVANAAEAARELQSGRRRAASRRCWSGAATSQVFVTVKKE